MQPIGDGTLTGYYDYSDRAEIDYQDLSNDIVRRRGPDWDNFFPNWNAAIAAANACAASGQNDAIACDDAYWNASGLRKDHLGYLALDLPLGESLQWKTTAYGHQNRGQGLWGTPYTPTPGGAPLSMRSTEYDLKRFGVLTSLTWTGGAHEVERRRLVRDQRLHAGASLLRRAVEHRPDARLRRSCRAMRSRRIGNTTSTPSRTCSICRTRGRSPTTLRLNFGFRSVHAENTAKTVAAIVPRS